ncbi:hypothetical protein CHS0354_007413 [Potamilus streckersoni]|uniref:protein-tyrosine-phosphatase n=1 Tax=Potamilus streckersoni TaxID=2493646 RepID=A0AAE0SVQ1_9BIVA|nr:hypothetical protein CHS0354_007413 [Potamilus streckersoni]
MYNVDLTLLVFSLVLTEPPMCFSTTPETSIASTLSSTTRTTTTSITTTTVQVTSTLRCSNATAVNSSSLIAYWQDDGGNATDFRIHVEGLNKEFNISKYSTCSISNECNIVITGLSPGTNYSIKVIALASGTENGESCSLSGITMPITPHCLNVTGVNSSSIKAYWQDGGNTTDFRVHVEGRNINYIISKYDTCLNDSNECILVIADLSPGTNYSVQIFALAYGTENEDSCLFSGISMPVTPHCLNVTAINSSSIKAYWQDGGNATDFRVHVDGLNKSFNISKYASCPNFTNECNLVITDLSPGTNYSVKVIALAFGTENEESCPLSGNTMPITPHCLNVTAVNSSSIKAYWRDGGNATDFRVHVDGLNISYSVSNYSTCSNRNECNHVITDLSPGTNFSVNVFALSFGTENEESCSFSGNTMPVSPHCVNMTSVNSSSIKVYWQDGGNATDFRVHVDGLNKSVIISKYASCPNLTSECNLVITDLSPGTNYSIKVVALAYGTESEEFCSLSGNTMPATPHCLNVKAINSSSIKAYWRDGGNATDFRVHVEGLKKEFNISKYSTCSISNECNIVITDLSPGTNYSVKVVALAYGTENGKSCYLSGNTMPITPHCLNATAVNSSSIKTYWQNGGNATDFRVYVEGLNKTSNISKYSACSNSNECSLVITDLSPGTNYSVKVFALAYGTENGEYCSLSGNTMPVTPHCLNVQTINSSSIQAYWQDGGNATDFRVHVDGLNKRFNISKYASCSNLMSECSLVITDLSPGTNYSFKVVALAFGTENGESCSLSGNTMPVAPHCLNVTAVNSSAIKAYWQNGGNATDFRVYVVGLNKTSNISKYSACSNSNECNLVITDLSPGTNYSIKVFALSFGTENGEYCSLSGNTMPIIPHCLNVTAVNSSAIKAYWQDGGNATDFRIHVEGLNITSNISKYPACSNSNECNLVITDLSPGTNYSIKIFSLAFDTENGESCSFSGNTMPVTPHCLNVTAINSSSIKAYWHDGGNATDFRVHVEGLNKSVIISKYASCSDFTNECNLVITDLSPGTNYSIKVFALSFGTANGEYCSLSGNTMPFTPHCLNVTAINSSSIKAYWQDGGNATDFRVYVEGLKKTFNISKHSTCFNSNECNYVITDLSPGTNYSVKVFALAFGTANGEYCSLSGNTMPFTPHCLNVTAINSSSIKAYWQDGGNATDFRVHVEGLNKIVNISKYASCSNFTNDCNLVITDLSPGTNYSIKVFALSFGIENGESCSFSGNTMPITPHCFNVTAVNSASINAYWQDGGNATDFRVYVEELNKTYSVSKYATCLNFSNQCNLVITDLSPGTNYRMKVFALSYGTENGKFCSFSGNTMPSSPHCLNVTAVNSSSLKAYWKDGGNATNFRVYVEGLNTSFNISKYDKCLNYSNECSLIITDLSPGTKYGIKIVALAYGIENGQSCSLSGNAIPSKPIDCAVLERTTHNFTIKWSNGPGDRDVYRVNYSCFSPNKPNETLKYYMNHRPDQIYKSIHLDPGTFCELQIYAVVNETNTLSHPLVCNVATNETAPGTVDNLYIFNITSTSMSINWSTPSERNGLIRGYLLTVIENVGYCAEVQSCAQHYDFFIYSKHEDYTCQDIEESIEIKECLINDAIRNNGSFVLDKLKPHVNYSIWLRAYTVCAGDKKIKTARTLSTGPHQPSNINATAISPQTIRVTWDSADLCTGITSYSVIYTDDVNNTGISIANCSNSRTDFGLKECTILGLEEYWQYSISVKASVDGFLPNISSSVNVTTLESTPGPVETLELTPEHNPNNSRSMLVRWKPPIPRQRNGVILFYKIAYYYNLSDVVEIVLASNESQTLLDYLTAGKIYFVNISANTSKGYGEIVQRNETISSGAPDPPTKPLLKSTAQVPDPTRQIAVDLPVSSFLCNTKYGFPERWGVVVSQYSKATDNPFRGNASVFDAKLKSYRSWRNIRNEDNFPPYRATYDGWKPIESCGSQARRRRSTETVNGPDLVSFIIGQDSDCTSTNQHFCNGYLKPNTEYGFRVYVCTSDGCTESMWSSPIKTDKDNTTVIVVLSVVLSLLLLLSIVSIIVLRARRRMCFKVDKTSGPYLNQGDYDLSLTGAKINVHRPIQLSHLRMHVEHMHKDSNIGFSSEYKFIKEIEPKHTTDIAGSESCRSKNRYTNILPYDHSRVKLLPTEDEEGSDYINANYIQGCNSKREYIATQGPLPATRDDFWRMVWEQNAEIIVMLTKCMEKGRVKCDKYWPDVNEPVYYGELIVNVTSESILSDYIIRVIELKLNTGENQMARKIYHFSFLNWPDMGCPKDPAALLNFITSVRTYMKPNYQSPIIVHCSAGVGRTGTFIAIDHLMQHLRDSVEVDIFNLVYEMRNQRCNMVQTEDQYVYIHDSILELITEDEDGEEEEPIYENKHMDVENVYENTAFIKE